MRLHFFDILVNRKFNNNSFRQSGCALSPPQSKAPRSHAAFEDADKHPGPLDEFPHVRHSLIAMHGHATASLLPLFCETVEE